MGDLDQIELLEEYIEDFGKELKSIKKASEYLELIERFQDEITRTTDIMDQSKDNMVAHQELATTKLSLYQSILQGIEHKQKSLEELQKNTLDDLSGFDQKYEKYMNESNKSIKELFSNVNENRTMIETLSKEQMDHRGFLFKKLYMIVGGFLGLNMALGVVILFILLNGK
ncbi:hypothetical protein [Sporosarcina sp. FSL K6-2383]|uniref:hypothetical protein n=1 Tax=Sporosarcina sp. FSL K6-2383 TaxID=2921556 RepID=UPI00315AB90E